MKAQLIFGWFEDSLNRSVVRSLCVCRRDLPEIHPNVREAHIDDGSELGDWFVRWSFGKEKRGKDSARISPAYSTWLKWFTPLSHSDFAHVVVE